MRTTNVGPDCRRLLHCDLGLLKQEALQNNFVASYFQRRADAVAELVLGSDCVLQKPRKVGHPTLGRLGRAHSKLCSSLMLEKLSIHRFVRLSL